MAGSSAVLKGSNRISPGPELFSHIKRKAHKSARCLLQQLIRIHRIPARRQLLHELEAPVAGRVVRLEEDAGIIRWHLEALDFLVERQDLLPPKLAKEESELQNHILPSSRASLFRRRAFGMSHID